MREGDKDAAAGQAQMPVDSRVRSSGGERNDSSPSKTGDDDGLGPADEDEDETGLPDEDVDETSAGGLHFPDDPPHPTETSVQGCG